MRLFTPTLAATNAANRLRRTHFRQEQAEMGPTHHCHTTARYVRVHGLCTRWLPYAKLRRVA